jgi:hypothetical protein
VTHPKVVIPEARFCEARNEPTKLATLESRGSKSKSIFFSPWIPDIHKFGGFATIYEFLR